VVRPAGSARLGPAETAASSPLRPHARDFRYGYSQTWTSSNDLVSLQPSTRPVAFVVTGRVEPARLMSEIVRVLEPGTQSSQRGVSIDEQPTVRDAGEVGMSAEPRLS
jgi:hypothetical protein